MYHAIFQSSFLSDLVRLVLILLLALVARVSKASEKAVSSPVDDESPIKRYALVVGSNHALTGGQAPLRFADDDAARMAELLEESGVHVELLTSFDRESQELFANMVGRVHRPNRAGLKSAMQRLREKMSKERAESRVEFLFYYSGHGDIGGDGQRYLTLEGEKLSRRDFFGEVLAVSPAHANHVMIDACQSEKFVLSRGEWKNDRVAGKHQKEVQFQLQQNQLGQFPNTGVILASSVDQQTHEWERYGGGIFTHELLSGLRGGADINGDGRIEYSELGAFVSSANRGVDNPRARLDVTLVAPANEQRAAILSFAAIADKRVLYFAGQRAAHYSVEDGRGLRVADLHRGIGRPAYLKIPEGDFFIYQEASKSDGAGSNHKRQESVIRAKQRGRIDVEGLTFQESTRAARGAMDEALREGLFEYPYSVGFYDGFTQSQGMMSVAQPEWEIQVWQRNQEGEMEEVARINPSAAAEKPSEQAAASNKPEQQKTPKAKVEGPQADRDADENGEDEGEELDCEELMGDWSRLKEWEKCEEHFKKNIWWGSLSVGMIFTPYNPEGSIRDDRSRVIANEFHGFGNSGFGQPLRGFDLRWWSFETDTVRERPGAEGYFRTGYTQGGTDFYSSGSDAPASQRAEHLDYFTVPLFFGGNVYAFKRFPLRPFAGAGVGFDVLRLRYRLADGSYKTDASARIGFELHAGLDLRINNYFSLVAEIRQLWSAKRRIAHLPDFSNEGLTAVGSLRFGFDLRRRK